jgi:Flp pilus assembly pilin Flp
MFRLAAHAPVQRFLRDISAATAIEYGLMAAGGMSLPMLK